jgi:hypothetical protein
MSASLFSRVLPRAELEPGLRREMLALMKVCYEGVSSERFHADLDAKQFVILLYAKATHRLVGFSTIRLAEERLEGRRVSLLFSGDTAIHPDHWGDKTLQTAFGHFVLRQKLRNPQRPCLWLLLSGGYKTYLMMTNHFPRSFPRRLHEVEPARRQFLDRVAREWFGDTYDPARGVVRSTASSYRVRRGLAPVDPETARHPDVAFFIERNPRHAEGDELVCLAEIQIRDLLSTLTRIMMVQARLAPRAPRTPRSAPVADEPVEV